MFKTFNFSNNNFYECDGGILAKIALRENGKQNIQYFYTLIISQPHTERRKRSQEESLCAAKTME
jgi:hypothetical protein